jgi:hypothetical protein
VIKCSMQSITLERVFVEPSIRIMAAFLVFCSISSAAKPAPINVERATAYFD